LVSIHQKEFYYTDHREQAKRFVREPLLTVQTLVLFELSVLNSSKNTLGRFVYLFIYFFLY